MCKLKDEIYMQRAIDLARMGLGSVSSNPLVGCVIVHNNHIIGEGYHQKYGGAHAEVNAINSVQNKELLKDATLYVNLEPCNHFGKTPPCSQLIVEQQISKVVIANIDPFEDVNGSGIQHLKQNGVQIITDVLKLEGEKLNKRFFTFHTQKRPYIILKWAQTQDGFIAKENYESKWISNELSRTLVHKWRAEEDAILVGFNTVKYDNPHLTCRLVSGKNPTRILIDRKLETNMVLNIFDNEANTIVINEKITQTKDNILFQKIDFNRFHEELLGVLFQLEIQSVIIEGGSNTIQNFIQSNMWDEARVFVSNTMFAKGIKAPKISTLPNETLQIEDDILYCYYNG